MTGTRWAPLCRQRPYSPSSGTELPSVRPPFRPSGLHVHQFRWWPPACWASHRSTALTNHRRDGGIPLRPGQGRRRVAAARASRDVRTSAEQSIDPGMRPPLFARSSGDHPDSMRVFTSAPCFSKRFRDSPGTDRSRREACARSDFCARIRVPRREWRSLRSRAGSGGRGLAGSRTNSCSGPAGVRRRGSSRIFTILPSAEIVKGLPCKTSLE